MESASNNKGDGYYMIYVTSDIHGRYDRLQKLIKEIDFKDEDTLYILGDMVDRGKESISVVTYCMKKQNIKVLMGNHEDMMLRAQNGGVEYKNLWFQNGGRRTYEEFVRLANDEKQYILRYLTNLPKYFEIDVNGQSYILVHAGINPNDIDKPLSKHDSEDLLWIREDFHNEQCYEDKIIVFGHTPTRYLNKDKSMKIWYGRNKIGIDCGAVFEAYGGKLACLRLDDMKEFYIF